MKKILFIVSIIWVHAALAQQDPLWSQYQFNQLPINPAYTGVSKVTSFDLQYRSPLRSVEGGPTTAMASGSSALADHSMGLGFLLIHDQLGVNTNTDFNLTYGYHLQLSEQTTLSMGLQMGLQSLQYDFEKLDLEDLSDEDFIGAGDGFTKFNAGMGLFISHQQFYVGFSIPKILRVKEEIGENVGRRYNQHFYATAGIIIELPSDNVLKPYIITRGTTGTPLSTDIGLSALFEGAFWGGLFTRNFKTYGFSAFLTLSNDLRFGYTGELTSTDLETVFSTHEISLGLDLALFDNQSVTKRHY